jgi:outer membrane immunogenic protein
MRRFLFSTIALATLTGSVFAADLPSSKSTPFIEPVTAYNWTGFYLGADVGGEWKTSKISNLNASVSASSVLGGGYAGYNYQINQFVLGLQGGVDVTGANGANALAGLTVKESYLASIDGRLGVAVDRALFYAIGGVAFTNTRFAFGGQNFTNDMTGYDIGAGVQYAFLPNWSVRAEYRYYDFGAKNFVPVNGGAFSFSGNENVVRVGLDYRFSAQAAPFPVAAKY